MGLITKEVEVGLGGKNIKYYENLGYKIPKYENNNHQMCVKLGTKIKVLIKDLNKGSNAYVEYECDMCHKIFKTRYDDYCKHNRDGITLCLTCVGYKQLTKEYRINNKNNKQNNNYRGREMNDGYLSFIKKSIKKRQL